MLYQEKTFFHRKGEIMALVKYGGGIVQMSGSIAGNTYARNRFGNYVRSRTKPVNPNSDRQVAARVRIAYLSEFWHETLSVNERGLWDTYAAAVAMTNKLGETINLTGFNHFIRSNSVRMLFHPGAVTFAPDVLSLPPKDPDLVCTEENIAGQTFTFSNDVDLFAANGDQFVTIMLDQGQPQLASRTFFNGPWRYMGGIDVAEGQAGTATENAAFTFALGQKVWFRARSYTNMGRVSESWILPPRTIVADP